jgi:hypothetical protein
MRLSFSGRLVNRSAYFGTNQAFWIARGVSGTLL